MGVAKGHEVDKYILIKSTRDHAAMEVKGLEYLGVVGGRDILIKYFFP
jgi:hypothetical protein